MTLMTPLLPDCIVPGCHTPAEPGSPCLDHLAAAADLFAWAWPNGLPRTLTPDEVAARRAEREIALAVARARLRAGAR